MPADVRVINTCTVTAKSDRTCRQRDPARQAPRPRLRGRGDRLLRPGRRRGHRRHPGCRPGARQPRQARPGGTIAAERRLRRRASADGTDATDLSRYLPMSIAPASRATVLHPFPRLHQRLSQDPDRLRLTLRLLHHPAGARPGAQHAAGARYSPRCDLLAARGYREVVLTGINLGSWGSDTGEGSLADLLDALVGRRRGPNVPPQLHRAPGGGCSAPGGHPRSRATGWLTISTCRSRAASTPCSGA